MKPFRRTQVITLMAACVTSIAWAQETPRVDQDTVREQIELARQKAISARDAARDAARDSVRIEINDQTRELTRELARAAEDGVWARGIGDAMLLAQDIAPKAAMPPMPPMPPMVGMKGWNFDYGGDSYAQGKSALDNYSYEKAIEKFDKVIGAKTASSHADGAYYWKAYALNKLGKRDEALAALAELSKQFPQSGWLNDAKALQAEVQQAKGQPVSPENQSDEDLKLYAINALINSDADRAVPLLEGLLGNPKMSPRLKERALFVLAQSRSDKAHEIVGRYAKGGSNPDLQLTAVRYLGSYRSKESRQLLTEVYASASDVNVKRAVLRSFENSRDIDDLAKIAKSEQNLELRREAIRQLGNIRDDQAVTNLVAIYGSESDREIKTEILSSLRNQQAAKQIVDCARKETDPELKKAAVRYLSEMRSKEATDFLMEILK
jgi:HEAT repeat protein